MPKFKTNNSGLTRDEVMKLQRGLHEKGFDPGPIDGVIGGMTNSAIIAFKRSRGLRPRAYVGPKTWEAITRVSKPVTTGLPWIDEAYRALKRHEVRDNSWLRKWLRSDGYTLGDPAQLPWCGDFVETSIRLALPNEPIPTNPYWALNWRKFGEPCPVMYGCVASVKRNGGGHVGFIVGEDRDRYFVLGGNQANKTSIVPMGKGRFVSASFRWPSTFRMPKSKGLPWYRNNQPSNTQEG